MKSAFGCCSQVWDVLLSLRISFNLISEQSVAVFSLGIKLSFLISLESLSFTMQVFLIFGSYKFRMSINNSFFFRKYLRFSSNFCSYLVFHPFKSISVLPVLVVLSELQLLKGLDLVNDGMILGSGDSSQFLVCFSLDKCTVENILSVNLSDLVLVALLTKSSKGNDYLMIFIEDNKIMLCLLSYHQKNMKLTYLGEKFDSMNLIL